MAWRPLGGAQGEPLPSLSAPQTVQGRGQRSLVDSYLSEARSCLDADPGELVERKGSVAVYKRPVQDGKGLTMSRLEAEVAMDPDKLFQLMTTMDGKCIIDPFPRERHSELVQPLPLPKGEARVVYSEAPRFIGLLRPREYVTCDAAATKERLFVCKSCELAEGPLAAPQKGKVRANLLFAMRMRPVEGQPGRTHMQMVNWLDLGRDTVPTWLANAITERWYFQALMKRLNRYTQQHGLVPKGS